MVRIGLLFRGAKIMLCHCWQWMGRIYSWRLVAAFAGRPLAVPFVYRAAVNRLLSRFPDTIRSPSGMGRHLLITGKFRGWPQWARWQHRETGFTWLGL